MDNKLLRFSLTCITGLLLASSITTPAMATEYPVAGFTHDITGIDIDPTSQDFDISSLSSDETPIPGFNNIGIANVETNLLVREKPSENGRIIGKMPKDSGCEILEPDKDGWTKITSGKIKEGYVKSEYLITGPEAQKKALEIASLVAAFNGTDNLRVRTDPSIPEGNPNENVFDSIAPGEEILVLDSKVVTYGQKINKWVKVSLDGDDSENGTVGYVAKEYVDLSYKLPQAYTLDELYTGLTGVSDKRANIVTYAKKFLGYRYVFGGQGKKSLLNNWGVDCSAFVQIIFAEYGYSLPRTSREQAKRGTSISTSQLKPGDLIFYGSKSYINHVAIYIGNGRIVHASNKRDGVKISNAFYRTPVKCVRIIND